MNRLKISCAALAAALVCIRLAPVPAAAQGQRRTGQPAAPRLIVMLVVDQLRGDYLTEYGGTFTAGLRRLTREGAWFTQAAYPYLNTVTCAGHATIGTGTFPYQHGMILNAWLDRKTGRSPYCTDDATVQDISYNGLSPGVGDSPALLLRPSLAEQVLARGGRSVVMSLKPRSSIPVAGHKATAVVWFDDRGGWSTSSSFTPEPVPFIKQFLDANPMSAYFGKVWDRSLDPSAYKYTDDGTGERGPTGWSRIFPHPLGEPNEKSATEFYARWQRSPYADEYLARMGMAAVDSLKLGQGAATDFLGISFSSLDLIGHGYGPRSHEVQDHLVRLDKTLGDLLAHLDKTVGAGNYVLGLSADHGVAEVPDQSGQGGRITGKEIGTILNKALIPVLGDGNHVASTAYTDLYLSEPARAALNRDKRVFEAAAEALRAIPAIGWVFRGEELATRPARESSDPIRRAAALSYHKDRSGDVIIVPREGWLLSSSVTTHGTHHAYDQRVPVIVFGASVRAGEYTNAASPADLAPTLAQVAGVRIARTDGQPLTVALTATTEK